VTGRKIVLHHQPNELVPRIAVLVQHLNPSKLKRELASGKMKHTSGARDGLPKQRCAFLLTRNVLILE